MFENDIVAIVNKINLKSIYHSIQIGGNIRISQKIRRLIFQKVGKPSTPTDTWGRAALISIKIIDLFHTFHAKNIK